MSKNKNVVAAIDNWNDFGEAALLGYSDAVLTMAMVETIERSNAKSCIGAIEDDKAGRAAQLIRDALSFRLHMFIVRAFIPVSRKDDLHLRAAIEFLERLPSLDDLGPSVDPERLQWAVSTFQGVQGSDRLERLKKMRDKRLAHMARYDERERPTYNDLFYLAKMTSGIWENLARGAAAMHLEVGTQVIAYRRSADRFWSKFDGVRFMIDDDEQFDLV